ncbi:MAG: MFS transporter, partial [Bacillota bacterium]|nr:MFS transporter [Bacillota bacterium]
MSQVKRTLTVSILSLSILTVMAGAAVAPALGVIKAHFSHSPAVLVQMIISMPALFIIITD